MNEEGYFILWAVYFHQTVDFNEQSFFILKSPGEVVWERALRGAVGIGTDRVLKSLYCVLPAIDRRCRSG